MEIDMQTFTFTIEQIKEIYEAGVRRGGDEATAFRFDAFADGNRIDECVDAIHDIINDGKTFDDINYTAYDVVQDWFK